MSDPIDNLEGGASVRVKINNLIAKTDLVEQYKIDAELSKTNAETWAEGEELAVVALGGEKSAKDWALEAAQTITDGRWEVDGVDKVKPLSGKTVDASNLSGTIDGGPLHP